MAKYLISFPSAAMVSVPLTSQGYPAYRLPLAARRASGTFDCTQRARGICASMRTLLLIALSLLPALARAQVVSGDTVLAPRQSLSTSNGKRADGEPWVSYIFAVKHGSTIRLVRVYAGSENLLQVLDGDVDLAKSGAQGPPSPK